VVKEGAYTLKDLIFNRYSYRNPEELISLASSLPSEDISLVYKEGTKLKYYYPFRNYGKLKFEFDFRTGDWDTIETKIANFYYKGENYLIELDANNQCYVPKEVIYSPSFSVAVYGGDIVTNYVKNPVDVIKTNTGTIPPTSDDGSANSIVFVPSIDKDKILSWTISESTDNLKIPDPVDLWPHDEWSDDGDIVSEYEWEDDF
jgi:hypothetical protein